MKSIASPLDGFGRGGPFRSSVGTTVNRPVITYPSSQTILLTSAPLVFASSISVSDAVDTSLTMTLTFTGGTITLDGTTGLSFSVGDGTADSTMTFSGTITNINNALSGMSVTAASVGDRTLSITATNTTESRTADIAVQFGSVPANTAAPAISGTNAIGQILTSSTGTFTGYPAPTITYQWQRDGVNISGETSATYVLALADFEAAITCEVTGTNGYGSDMEETASITPLDAAPVNTVVPAISGNSDYGSVLTCSTGTWTGYPTPTLTYQWQSNGVDISGQTANTYTTVFGDVGDSITCEVTGTNTYGAVTVETSPVVVNDPAVYSPGLDFSFSQNSQYVETIGVV